MCGKMGAWKAETAFRLSKDLSPHGKCHGSAVACLTSLRRGKKIHDHELTLTQRSLMSKVGPVGPDSENLFPILEDWGSSRVCPD